MDETAVKAMDEVGGRMSELQRDLAALLAYFGEPAGGGDSLGVRVDSFVSLMADLLADLQSVLAENLARRRAVEDSRRRGSTGRDAALKVQARAPKSPGAGDDGEDGGRVRVAGIMQNQGKFEHAISIQC